MDWQHRYLEGSTPWDLRQPTPALEVLLASGRLSRLGLPDEADVAVPGCGRGHDLRAWARAGHRVTGFDIAPEAVREARALLAWNRVEGVDVLCRDLLGVGAELAARFDAVYDYTCLCALAPHLRARYGHEMAAIVRPGGLWIGLAFPLVLRPGAEGPPFAVDARVLHAALAPRFALVDEFEPERSVAARRGAERWFVWRRDG